MAINKTGKHLRAKIKPEDQLPQHAKCCSDMLKSVLFCASQEVEVFRIPVEHHLPRCPFCGNQPASMLCYILVDGRGYFPVDCADIDEGEDS